MPKRILIYGPFNSRSRDVESVILGLKKEGHELIFLSQMEGKGIIDFLKSKGIPAHRFVPPSFLNHYLSLFIKFLHFIYFCYTRRINVVFSHLEPANLVSAAASYVVFSKIYLCRHHVDEIHLLNGQHSASYKFMYKQSGCNIIVVSERAKQFMIDEEGVNPDKIQVINLSYYLNLFDTPDQHKIAEIKMNYSARMVMLTACRMVKDKRPEYSVELLKKMAEAGYDAKLLLLGRGDMGDELNQLIEKYKLTDRCVYLGYQSNIMDYLSACDVLIHPSVLDSSSVITKEAGVVSKPVVVCKGVGDFEAYIIDKQNGFLVDKNNFVNEAFDRVTALYNHPEQFSSMGENLRKDVIRLFSIENNIEKYNALLR